MPSLRRLSAALFSLIVCVPAIAAEGLSFHAIGAEPLGRVPPGAIVLHDDWTIQEEPAGGIDGARISTAGFDARKWYATSVPTTVLGALVRAGVYPDPYVGRNNDRIPDASAAGSPWRRPWWFRRDLDLPAAYAGKVIWLHLDGINYRAAVWVNGKQVANERETVGMFHRFRFDISRLARPGRNNTLAIRIFPVDYPGVPGYREPGSDIRFQTNVTEMSALGWDWVPPARDRNMGIWQHVWLESSGPVAVSDPAAFTDVQLLGGRQAAVTVRVEVRNASGKAVKAEVVARISEGGQGAPIVEVRRTVEMNGGASREVIFTPAEYPRLNVHNPRLWWPHGYGGQPLYDLTVEARVNGALSHRQAVRFGFRKLGYFYRPSKYAHTLIPIPDGLGPYDYPAVKAARVFTVNGREIRLAGGSMVPDFLLTWDAQRYRDEVRMMVEGNHTIVRIWGGGIIMPDSFYDEADRRGLLVWQDLARSSFGSAWKKKEAELPPVDKDLYLANMRDVILRLRGRTSLLAWCGTNEGIEQTDIGQTLQNDVLPALDGSRAWIPSSSTEPPWATEPLGMRSFGPYQIQDLRFYFDKYAHADDFLFKNELGMESPPRYNSILEAIRDVSEPAQPGSWVTQALLDHGLPYRNLNPRITPRIAAPAGLADFLSMSELLSAQGLRAIYEAANKARPRNPGTMIWMTNAAWPDFMYALYDWHLHPTAGYYAVKSAAKPLHVQYALDDPTVQVASTLAEKLAVRVRAALMSPEGKIEEVKNYELTAGADSTTPVGPAPAAIADGNLHFLGLDLLDSAGRELDRLVTWSQKDERWRALAKLPPVRVAAHLVRQTSAGGETRYRVAVRNAGGVPAVDVWVGILKGAQGEEVLPSFWSDNAINLLPGEQRELTVRFRSSLLGGAAPELMVEGFNVIPEESSVAASGIAAPLVLRITGLSLERENGQPALKVVSTQTGTAGPRWTLWPVAVLVDGRRDRCFRIEVKTGVESTALLPLSLGPGAHRIQVGDQSLTVPPEPR